MGMAAGSKGVKSEINVTPLVDVMLVLLIIFMVVTPMLQDGVDVQMAMTKAPQSLPKSSDDTQITISMKYTGDAACAEIWFKDEWQNYENPQRCEGLAALKGKLTELRERKPGTQILIKADRRLHFGSIRKVMKECNTNGFESVALINQKLPSAES